MWHGSSSVKWATPPANAGPDGLRCQRRTSARLQRPQRRCAKGIYYGGEGEYAQDTAVFGSRRKKGETVWSTPRAIARDPFRSLGNGVVWQAPDGVVWLFYVVRFGETWSTSRIQAKVSHDNAETWSDAFMLAPEEGMMVRNRPIVLTSGEYLLPAYHETGHDTESVGPDTTSRFFRFDPAAKRWQQTGPIRSPTGNLQPAVVQISDTHLIAYCRRGGDYKPTTEGWLIRAESHDGGETWSEGRNSRFPNPNSAVELLKLKSGYGADGSGMAPSCWSSPTTS